MRYALIAAVLALTLAACGDDDGATPTPSVNAGSPGVTRSPSVSASREPTQTPGSSTITVEFGWSTFARIPTPRSEVAVAAFDGRVYVIGGFDTSGASSQAVEIYDPETDSWSGGTPLPEPRHHAAAVVVDGGPGIAPTLYVIGGYGIGFGDPEDTLYRLTPDGWQERARLSSARGGLGAAVIEGRIYAAGGAGSPGAQTALEVYDPAADAWQTLAPVPTGRDHLAVVAIDGKLYAIGGRENVDFGRNLDANEAYDPQTDTWSPRAPLPTVRSGIAGAMVDGRAYIFGGEGSGGTFDENESYDPVADAWEKHEPMPTARHGIGAAVIGGVIYVPSGGPAPGFSVTAANEAYTP